MSEKTLFQSRSVISYLGAICMFAAVAIYCTSGTDEITVDPSVYDVGDYTIVSVEGNQCGLRSARSDKSSLRYGRFIDGTKPQVGEVLPLKVRFQKQDPNNNCYFLVFRTD